MLDSRCWILDSGSAQSTQNHFSQELLRRTEIQYLAYPAYQAYLAYQAYPAYPNYFFSTNLTTY